MKAAPQTLSCDSVDSSKGPRSPLSNSSGQLLLPSSCSLLHGSGTSQEQESRSLPSPSWEIGFSLEEMLIRCTSVCRSRQVTQSKSRQTQVKGRWQAPGSRLLSVLESSLGVCVLRTNSTYRHLYVSRSGSPELYGKFLCLLS